MFISDYERMGKDLRSLPVSLLRAIDIRSVDEEKKIQEILNEKLQNKVSWSAVSIEDIKRKMDKDLTTRTLTKDKEKEYQKEVDIRVAKANPQIKPIESENKPVSDKIKKLKDK